MKPTIISMLIVFAFITNTYAQRFAKLDSLIKPAFNVYYSAGAIHRATEISNQVEKAMNFYYDLLGFKPTITLLVLNAADWPTYTSFPVYGMPHYNDTKTLVVASDDNPFWQSFLPPLNQLPNTLQKEIKKAYGMKDGTLSMRAFFDLLAIHELGHAFHLQHKLTVQRKWMGELFCNIFLHTYVATLAPHLLDELTVFPKMVVANGTREFKYTSLQDIEERYNEIGQHHPKNYGWYQCKWHVAAATIYDAGGKKVVQDLWLQLKNKEILSDPDLLSLFSTIHPSLADVMRNWENE